MNTIIEHNTTASKAYLIQGIPKSFIHHLCINNFHFPEEYRDTLIKYNILHWSSEHVFNVMKAGVINDGINDYLIVWDDCTPFTARKCDSLKLSFRKCRKEFDIPCYVVIRRGN